MNDLKYFLGLDLSLNGTGISVLSHDGSLIESKLIKLNTNKTNLYKGQARIKVIVDIILSILNKYSPQRVAVEGYSFGSKGRSFIDLAELGGVVRYELTNRKLDWVEIPPKTLKKMVSGNGNADKVQMMEAVHQRYGVKFEDDNENDAYCLARALIDHTPESLLEMAGERTKKKKKKSKKIEDPI